MAASSATTAATMKNAVSAAATAISNAMKVSVKVTSFGVTAGNKVGSGAASLAAKAAAAAAAENSKKAAARAAAQSTANRTTATRSGTQKAQSNRILLKWCDIAFYANSSEVRGFRDLSISSSCETEDEEQGGEKYVKLKNKKGFEISLKAYFDKRLGITDVKSAAMKIANYATVGQSGYFYAQNAKLVSTNMMLTGAKVQNVQMTPYGGWISAEVQMTLKSCSKLGDMSGGSSGGSSGGGGGGGGGSSKSASSTTATTNAIAQQAATVAKKFTDTVAKIGTAISQLNKAKTTSDKTEKTEKKIGVTPRAAEVAGAKNNKTRTITKTVLPK